MPNGPRKLYDKIKELDFEIDILINNAGIGIVESSEMIDFESDESLMRLNMISLVEMCKLFLVDMYKNKKGQILNVSSIAAFQPGPYQSTYFASKSFVLSYSRAIRYEAKKYGVKVSVLCPGTTKTDFYKKAGINMSGFSGNPVKVAEYTCKKLCKNKAIIIPGFTNRLSRLIPTSIKIPLVAMMKNQ